jgi:hypothetical protein
LSISNFLSMTSVMVPHDWPGTSCIVWTSSYLSLSLSLISHFCCYSLKQSYAHTHMTHIFLFVWVLLYKCDDVYIQRQTIFPQKFFELQNETKKIPTDPL